MFDTTMFDLNADGSGDDRCEACGSLITAGCTYR
jgi:hypothetical protein